MESSESDRKQADLADKGADAYKELVQKRKADAERKEEEQRQAVDTARFERVAQSMRFILDAEQGRDALDRLPEGLTAKERQGLEWLHAAMYSKNSATVGHISGAERQQELNKALAVLQPALATGLAPNLASADKLYAKVTERVVALRGEIKQRVLAETTKFKGPSSELDEEEDQDDGDDEDDDGDNDAQIDDDVNEMKKKKKKGLLRRLFRGDDKAAETDEEHEGDE